MITVYSEAHALRHPRTELHGGQLVSPFESPARALMVLEQVRAVKLGDVVAPEEFGLEALVRVHDRGFVDFLSTAWPEWVAAGNLGEAIPDCWPARRMTQRCPSGIVGKLGFYAMAGETSISEGSWEAARASANVALSAARIVSQGAQSAFALCRPPGHHAARDLYGGYCFLNNAALAAQFLRDNGARRIAIVDVDFHHGNGTQDIFFSRSDVLYVSLHGDPAHAFPYFSGYADEAGEGPGHGFNINCPLPPGSDFAEWSQVLSGTLERVKQFRPDAVVVSLGVDTYAGDPISFFRFASADFCSLGRLIRGIGLPTLFVFEGGYAVADVGINTVNVLTGFEEGATSRGA